MLGKQQSFHTAFILTRYFSWGTKGDNTIAKDLGIVKVSDEKEKGVKTAEVELPADQYDINCQYDAALFALDDRPSKMEVGLYKVLW